MIPANYLVFGKKYTFELLTGLVGYYPFNSNANDFSGKGYNGTIAGTPSFNTGKVGNAIDFIATQGNYINVADNSDFSFTNGTTDVPFTICMWVYFNIDYASIENSIINKWTPVGNYEWKFFIERATRSLCFVKGQSGGNTVYQKINASYNAFTYNTFHHICYTDNGTGLIGSGKLYINGILNVATNQNVGGVYSAMANTTSITRIGQLGATISGNYHHYGKIDELAIWKNRELTASEVLELYTKGNSGQPIL